MHKILLLVSSKKDKQISRRGDLSKEHEYPKLRKAAYFLAVGHNGKNPPSHKVCSFAIGTCPKRALKSTEAWKRCISKLNQEIY